MIRYLWAALLLLISVTAASAQGSAVNIQCLTGSSPAWSICNGTNPFPVTIISGGGGIAATVNVAQINGVTPLMGNGVTGTGSQRVTIASDNTAFSVNATLSAETTKVIGTVNQGTSPWLTLTTPSSSSSIGITPIVSASAEATHVLKATPGNVYSAYATNLTSTAGYLVILNSTTAPADGAITPLACALLAPNGVASINYAPGPPGVFSTGITAVVTSASTCFTKTTGVITAFISGSVQ